MKPAIKPVDNSKKSVTSLQTPLSEDLVKVLENYRIARLSLPGKWRRNVQIKKKDLGRRSTLSNVSRGSLLLWNDGHHQKTLTWHLGGGIPICQEYGERQNTENWKEYSGYLWGADCASVWFIRGTKNSQSFHGWGHNQSATPICCPTQWPRNYLSKAKCLWTIYFLAENFQNWLSSIFLSKSNYHQEIPKLNANKKTCSPGSTTDSKQSAAPHRLALTLWQNSK